MPKKRRAEKTWESLALQQLDAIAVGLAQRRSRHSGIHAARKAIRRLRSMLAMSASVAGSAVERLDDRLRALARSLSRLRDAQVAVEIAERLRRRSREPEAKALWTCLRAPLATRRLAVLKNAVEQDPDFARRIQRVERLRKPLQLLPWHLLDQTVVELALTRSHRRTLKAERATEHGNELARHRWRRRLRRLRMQLEAVGELGMVHGLNCSLDWVRKQVDQIGAAQDLDLLARHLRALPRSPERLAGLRKLRAMAPKVAPGASRVKTK